MNKIITLSLLTAAIGLQASAQDKNKLQQDKAAIKSMCGCQDVTFEYTETFPGDTGYQPKGYHKIVDAVEYVTVADESNKRIVLQHLLVADGEVIKHWTEDWEYENQSLLKYDQDNKWTKIQLPAAQVKGQWSQKVYGVDDEPRYEGTATWVHFDGRHYWESAADAPLPRREYTTRKDYNVLHRVNRHELTSTGSLHIQDNLKVVRANGVDKVIVGEKGVNTYNRTDESKCSKAIAWWKENQAFWALVRKAWQQEFAANDNIALQRMVNNEPLYKAMSALEEKAAAKTLQGSELEKEIVKTVHQFATPQILSVR